MGQGQRAGGRVSRSPADCGLQVTGPPGFALEVAGTVLRVLQKDEPGATPIMILFVVLKHGQGALKHLSDNVDT